MLTEGVYFKSAREHTMKITRGRKGIWFMLIIAVMILILTWKISYEINNTPSDNWTWKIGFLQSNITNTTPIIPSDTMDLYLRMSTMKRSLPRYYETLLVQSMRYFWPNNFSMVVVLDDERSEDHLFAETIRQTFPYPRICYMEPVTDVDYPGKDRMQRDMFYPDKCTSKKYVAYLDTDTVFVSRVIPEMLFEDGKPVIVGVYGNISDYYWVMVAQTTANIFKTKEVMRCMSNFPVIVKVEHIVKLRKHLEKLHSMSFDRLLQEKKFHNMSQFNMMCQYIWMFHRNEYKFRLQFNQKLNKQLAPGRQDQTYYNQMLTQEQLVPFTRNCVHYKWYDKDGDWKSQETYTNIFKSSICFMGGFHLCPDKCKKYNNNSLRQAMFNFDYIDWTWDNRCLKAQQTHYKKLAEYDNSEYFDIIRKACKEVDSLIWKA